MLRRCIAALATAAVAWYAALSPAHAEEASFSFGVITQRSPVLTAQYWNPILRYVSEKSGVPLRLKLAKTGPEHSEMIGRGEFDFIYSNHNFNVKNDVVGYRVIARPIEAAIMGQIVVPADSPIQALSELAGKEVVFPSKVAFVGYYVPMDALLQAGVRVKPLFAGNQEGAMGQLKSGRVPAAAVNSQIMRDYAERERYAYRVLWSSEPYLNIPISAHPSVPAAKVKAVQAALVGMASDPEGQKILAASAHLIKQQPPYGFIAAGDKDFNNIRQFFRKTLVKE
ncbi:MAG: phosphate/phosphite/phosphonate ABC transporter substrate-binding protein [Rhodospirillaceae bacterium]